MRNVRQISSRLAIVAIVAVAAALYAALATAAGGPFAAHAQKPTYDSGALELTGTGGYTTLRSHKELKVTVCLQKRLGGRPFSVRCATGVGSGRRVTAKVGVPGCVKGTWRTTSSGEALNPKGEWVHQASATSAPFRC